MNNRPDDYDTFPYKKKNSAYRKPNFFHLHIYLSYTPHNQMARAWGSHILTIMQTVIDSSSPDERNTFPIKRKNSAYHKPRVFLTSTHKKEKSQLTASRGFFIFIYIYPIRHSANDYLYLRQSQS